MKKKIILILSMAALLVCVFAFSVGATSVTYVPTIDDYTGLNGSTGSSTAVYVNHGDVEGGNFLLVVFDINGSNYFYIDNIDAFLIRYKDCTISDFADEAASVNSSYYEGNATALEVLGYDENAFNYFINYEEVFSAEDFSAELNDLFNGYMSLNGENLTAEGFDSYVGSYGSDEFVLLYSSSGVNSSYESLYKAALSSSNSSSGSSNGSPTITDEELTGTGYDPTACTVCVGSAQDTCEHWQAGYDKGFYDGLLSEHNKEMLQQAYNQGFEYANSESFETTINNAKAEAVEEHLSSEEYRQAIETLKEQTLQEYCTSEEYENKLQNAFDSGKNTYYAMGYADGEEDGYSDGYLTGTVDFQASKTYKDSLQNYYSAGYNAGVDTQNGSDDSIVVLLGVFLTIGVVVALLLFASKKSRKRR